MESISRRDELLGIYSDIYKDVHGIRPRGMVEFMSDSLIESEINNLQEELNLEFALEREQEDRVATMLGVSRETLRRWEDEELDRFYASLYDDFEAPSPLPYEEYDNVA